MKNQYLYLTFFLFLAFTSIQAQQKLPDSAIFDKEEIKFADHPGLVFRTSKPYLRYQDWDMQHTGQPNFTVALEFTNRSETNITAIDFLVKLYDKKGQILSEYTCSTSPMTLSPKDGDVLKPGYKGTDVFFVSKDKSMQQSYGKLDFKITEVHKASADAMNDKPVFESPWQTFADYPGLSCRLSKPYLMIDQLSGNEMFAIAMEFKNESKNKIRFVYYNAVIYDDQGPLYENERQEFGDKYDPRPAGMDADFPTDYSGVNRAFYINEKSLFKSFKKIEITLTKVETVK